MRTHFLRWPPVPKGKVGPGLLAGGGNGTRTRTQFLRWPPVPKGKEGPGLPAGGGGNRTRTRTQFLRWSSVPKGKAGLPPKKRRSYVQTIATYMRSYLLVSGNIGVWEKRIYKPVENLRIKARHNEKLGDLVKHFLRFTFRVVYKAGIGNIETDFSSRYPILKTSEVVLEDKICLVNYSSLEEIRNDQNWFFIVDLEDNI